MLYKTRDTGQIFKRMVAHIGDLEGLVELRGDIKGENHSLEQKLSVIEDLVQYPYSLGHI